MVVSLIQLIAQTPDQPVQLEPAGMVMMGLSITIVCGLTTFCIFRIFRETSPEQHHHVPLDIDTHDRES